MRKIRSLFNKVELIEKRGERLMKHFRKKLLAKMKLKPGPELFPGVEKDDELWSILKRCLISTLREFTYINLIFS